MFDKIKFPRYLSSGILVCSVALILSASNASARDQPPPNLENLVIVGRVDAEYPNHSLSPAVTPCSNFLQPYLDWITGHATNHVSVTVVFNNAEGGLVTYSTGDLRGSGGDLVGNLTKLFSKNIISLGSGPMQGPMQPFSVRQPASVDITLAADGWVTWVERSFNNATFRYKAVCYSNGTAILLGKDASGVMTLKTRQGPR